MAGYPIPAGKKAWQYKEVKNLLGGLNSSNAPDSLQDNQAITLRNVKCWIDRIYSDTGYTTMGQVIRGTAQGVFEFLHQAGFIDYMLVTTKTVYKYVPSIDYWAIVAGTASTTTTGAVAGGTNIVPVTSTAGFSVNDFVAIATLNGKQLQTTISAINALNITLTDPIPASTSVANGAAFMRQVVLNGILDDQVVDTVITANDWWVFTNGVDIVKYYDGTKINDVPNLPSGGNVICKAVAFYNTALFLLNTTEGGLIYPNRVRRSNQTDPTNWTTGTAGFDDLLGTPDPIMAAEPLGAYLIVYKNRSIVRGTFIGASGINYYWETTIQSEGALSAGAVVSVGDYHAFVGHANVYEYTGGLEIEPIGDAIYYSTFGVEGDLSPTYVSRLQATYIEELDEVWITYPTGLSSDNACDRLLRYNAGEKFWYDRFFVDHLTGIGFYTRQADRAWQRLIGSWLQQTWSWNSTQSLANAPQTVLCVNSSQVMLYDYIQTLDNGKSIPYTIETKDFEMADATFRFDSLNLMMQGTGILIEYSTDRGINYHTLATVTNTLLDRVTVGKQFTATRIRFRITGTDPAFILEWFTMEYKTESISDYSKVVY